MLPALLADADPLPRGPPVLGLVDGERHAVRDVGVLLADDRVQHRQRLLPGERGPEEAVLVVARVTLKWRNDVDIQICQKNGKIGCVIPCCKLQHGITQPILRHF